MATTALTPGPVARGFLRLSGRLVVLLLLAVVLGVATYVTEERLVVIGLSSASATLLLLTVTAWTVARRHARRRQDEIGRVAQLCEGDIAATILTDDAGAVAYANAAARARYEPAPGAPLAEVMGKVFANPGGILFRLRARMEAEGSAREDILTRRGQLRLSSHRVGPGAILWRVDELPERSSGRSESMARAGSWRSCS